MSHPARPTTRRLRRVLAALVADATVGDAFRAARRLRGHQAPAGRVATVHPAPAEPTFAGPEADRCPVAIGGAP